jgi:hypothetical protein
MEFGNQTFSQSKDLRKAVRGELIQNMSLQNTLDRVGIEPDYGPEFLKVKKRGSDPLVTVNMSALSLGPAND